MAASAIDQFASREAVFIHQAVAVIVLVVLPVVGHGVDVGIVRVAVPAEEGRISGLEAVEPITVSVTQVLPSAG
ncbi:MAG TPA: hypothetical protein DDW36_03605 [Candidatus Magasanikbacteria bacterium]|nr:hypothetical protein [Candidatus Magasanikbacteria bacterium]